MSVQLRILLAVMVAGIVGAIINACAAALILGPGKLHFLMMPNRYYIAMAVAMFLPLIGLFSLGHIGRVLSLLALVIVPSLIAKLVLHVGAPWPLVLILNSFYAFGALVTYELIITKGRRS